MGVVDVAAAILVRDDGAVLLAQRPAGKVYAGYWEFPGGKVEPGEPVRDALFRELEEELGVHGERAYPWITQLFAYPHATVRLHFFRVPVWRGEPHGREDQALAWAQPGHVRLEPMLPANAPVLAALALPAEYAVSDAGGMGPQAFLEALERRLRGGLRLFQLREKTLGERDREQVAREALSLARIHGARMLVNSDLDLALRIAADGVHLTAAQAANLEKRPPMPLCAASCHSRAEVRHAASLGLDFVVLGPVKATASHPGARTLGWAGFEEAGGGATLPVYAIGGLVRADLEEAWRHGAHGIAMIRGAWRAG